MAILPPKVLMINIVSSSITTNWSNPNNPEDPYIGYPYQWEVVLSVTPQTHSNPNTPTPYYYVATDINVGDWISNSLGGAAFEIIGIVSVPDSTDITLLIEDIELFNTYNDPTSQGQGGPITGSGVLFSLDNDGVPILMGLESGILPDTFATDLISRFNYRNLQQKYIRVNQPGHTFVLGDVIQPNSSVSGTYMLATDTQSIDLAVGTVSDVGTPSSDWFNFEAFGEVVYNVSPSLTGSYGSLFYLDPVNPGKLTSARPTEFARPIYLRLNSATTAIRFDEPQPTGSETKNYKVPSLTEGQTTFTLPSDAFEVIAMSINGVEVDFTTATISGSTVVTFDPAANGYGIDTTDEVSFIYTT
jgi:hypothetical protein